MIAIKGAYGTEYSLETYKNEAIKAAKGLYYGQRVINKIKAAKSETEITNIMADARKGIKD